MNRTATGQLEDGTIHFTENDLLRSGSVSIRLLPVGDTPLILFPSAPKNSNKVYTGDPTPILSYRDDNNKLSFRCRHVRVKEDEKKGTPRVLCTHYWQDGQGVTIGTILSHCRSAHWRHSNNNIVNNVAGQRGVKTFFRVKKKRKSVIDAEAAATAGVDTGSGVGHTVSGNVASAAGSPTVNAAAAAAGSTNVNEAAADVADSVVEDMGEEQQDMDIDMSIQKQPPIVFMEYIPCRGIHYLDFKNIEFGLHYDFMKDYPWLIHSDTTQTAYQKSNLLCNVDWSVDSLGNFISKGCFGIVVRDRNNSSQVNATTTRAAKTACRDCISLQFNQKLMGVLTRSVSKDYGQLPNVLCPASQILHRASKMKEEVSQQRLASFNYERKIGTLSRRVDDHSRLMMSIQDRDVPALKRMMTVHFRNGGSISAFVDKCHRAADYSLVGHSTFQRRFIQRGCISKEGGYDKDAYKILLMTILMNKCGCSKLVHTYSFVHGGLSHRQMQRHTNDLHTVPHFRPRLTSCIMGDQGLMAIEKNMDDYFANPAFLSFIPDGKFIVSLHIDGINTDEKLGLDTDQLPHQITGICRHNTDATFDTYEDAERIEQSLADGDIHLSKEAEVFAIGLNHPTFTSLIHIAISPTCKKDDVIGESTNTVHEIVTTIRNKWHGYPISQRLIMATYNSDGAGQFRKGVGRVLSKDLPMPIRRVYIDEDGNSRCPLLNLVGGDDGTTASCDNDHLGKRFRARIKTSMGITIGVINFNKSDLTVILQLISVVQTADEAHRLFHPDDLMDVLETVRCLYAVGRLSTTAFTEFPAQWRSVPENYQKFRELRVLGRVSALMCTSIVGHMDDIEEDGNHMSLSEYLTTLSELAHILFVVYRRNKTEFIAAQNYRNWQEMIKNMFIAVTQAKVNGVTDFYWFLNTNKRIEEFFGILRSLRGGDMNFDADGLRSRVGDASLVSWIYSQHPEWENSSRHLKSSADRKNTRSWRGDTKVANVDVVKCWTEGKNRALNVLRTSRAFEEHELDISSIISSEPGVDMFRPYRKTIGVLAGDRAVYSLVDLDDEVDDQEPEDGTDNTNAN